MPTNATTRSRKRCRPPLPPNGLARECRRKSVTDRPGLCRSSSKRCHEPRSGSETIPAIVGLLRSPSPPSIVRLHLEAAVGATGRSPRPPNSHAPSSVPGHPSPVILRARSARRISPTIAEIPRYRLYKIVAGAAILNIGAKTWFRFAQRRLSASVERASKPPGTQPAFLLHSGSQIDRTYALEKSHPDLTGLKAHGDARMQSILGKIFLHRVVVDL